MSPPWVNTMSFPHSRNLRVKRKLWQHDGPLPPGSDARVLGGIQGRCILCGLRTRLRLSHVIPKWAYRWHKEAWGGKVRGLYLSIGARTEEQDGNKHYLMCDSCEQRASISEQYVQTLVVGGWLQKLRRRIVGFPKGYYFWIDVARICQFVSITALRCHYAPSAPFHNLKIPPLLRKRLRTKAFVDSPRKLPLVGAVKFVPPASDPNHDPRCDIYAQFEINDTLGPVFSALIGGWEWYLWFQPKVAYLSAVSLRRNWLVQVGTLPFNEYRLIKRMPEIVAKLRDKLRRH